MSLLNKHISLIGCGWLGLPLGEDLAKNGCLVKGSTTSPSKIELLKKAGIIPYIISINENGISGNLEDCLKGSEILIVNVPPGLRKNPEANFIKRTDLLCRHIENSDIKKVLFASSSSVYEDELNMPIITDESPLNGQSESAKQLIGAEQVFRSNSNFETTILRFGGLIGPDRHPVKHLAGRKNIKDPEGPINLIHRVDCIGIIKTVINNAHWNTDFNAVAPQHPSRESYYTLLCKTQHLPLPQFDHTTPSKGKIISNEKVEQILNYAFKQKL